MANAASLFANRAARILLEGYPGAGKTGALACLVDAGFKLRILAFDKMANMAPLFGYVKDKSKLANVDIVALEDQLRNGQKYMETVGIPQAFNEANKLMKRWSYVDEGTTVDLGRPSDWGPDTIVVLDSTTAMGAASMRRAMAMTNKTPLNRTQQVWGLAMDDQDAFMELTCSNRNRFHFIATAHLKMISPKDIGRDDDELTKELKKEAADIIPTRLYPSALGQQLPQQIARHFPCQLLVEPSYSGNKVTRIIRTIPRPELDIKLPAPDLPPELPISDGLVKVFEAITPGVAWCLAPENNQPVATAEGETNG